MFAMNWHKVVTVGIGLLVAGLLIASAGHSFVELNTPEKGILTSAGASGIALPAALAGPLGWLAAWIAHLLMKAGLPASPKKPAPTVADAPGPENPNAPADTPLDGPGMLKAFAQGPMRELSADLARAGMYGQVATVGAVAKEWGDK